MEQEHAEEAPVSSQVLHGSAVQGSRLPESCADSLDRHGARRWVGIAQGCTNSRAAASTYSANETIRCWIIGLGAGPSVMPFSSTRLCRVGRLAARLNACRRASCPSGLLASMLFRVHAAPPEHPPAFCAHAREAS